MELIAHGIGFAGMLLAVGAYLGLEQEWLSPRSVSFYALNLTGSLLLIVSLGINFNLGSFFVEVFWLIISGAGLTKTLYRKRSAYEV
ncbi:MAG: CBU_0592 family membrane protein [Fibrobacterota bacterium]